MSGIFHTIFYKPLFNALVFLYEYVTFEDLGLAIILLTIVVRFVLYPLFYKTFKNQLIIQKIQPEIKKIQEEHKNNKEKQAEKLLELWKAHKVNPFSGFFLLLIQFPILLALYQIFFSDFSLAISENLYSFIPMPSVVTSSFIDLINLSEKSIVLIVIAVILQYFQGKLSLARSPSGRGGGVQGMQRTMVFVGPALLLVFSGLVPSAVVLYWATGSAFSIVQQHLIQKSLDKNQSENVPRPNNNNS